MTNAQQPFDVFLSHNSQNKPQVQEIAQKLKERKLKPWLDVEQIAPGQSFQDEIQKAISQSKSAAIFVGSQKLGSWQLFEMKGIMQSCVENHTSVIPVLLPGIDQLPKELIFLKTFNWVSFSQKIDEEKALNDLEWGITGKNPTHSKSNKKPGRVPTSIDISKISSRLKMFVIDTAKRILKQILPTLIDYLGGKISTYQQQDDIKVTEIENEKIVDEITKQDFFITPIKDVLPSTNEDSGSEQQLMEVSSEIQIQLKQLFHFLVLSAQKRPDEINNETEKDVNQLANQIEKFPKDEIDKKVDEIVNARRREIVATRRAESKNVTPTVTIIDDTHSPNSQQTVKFKSLDDPSKKPSLENSESKIKLENRQNLMLEMSVLKIATLVVKQVLPTVLPKLINYVLEKLIKNRQQENTETIVVKEEIIEEITKEEFIIQVIKNLLQQRIDNFEYNQEQVMPKVLDEIQILLKQVLDFLISSLQTRLSEDNIETDKEFVELKKQLETRDQLETMEVEKKIDEFAVARRTELEVKNQPQQPIARSSQSTQLVVNENQDHQFSEIKTSAEPVEVKSRHSGEATHPGWLAIDFGTSNSTVTVFDQKEVRESNKELSKQQRVCLSKLFKDWLSSQPPENPDGINDQNWKNFWKNVSEQLSSAGQGSINEILGSEATSNLLELTRQIELCLGNEELFLRKEVSKKLNDIYHKVFQVPPLEDESLILVELDPNTPNEYQIISELEITSLGDPLGAEMGSLVSKNRLASISNDTFKNFQGKFHPSPKRYFIAQDPEYIDVNLGTEPKRVLVENLVKSAWHCLIELTEGVDESKKSYRSRNPEKFTKGKFRRAIVTYPTVASPVVRRKIEKLVSDLGFTDVKTFYDEAIAAAIFYLWQEFSGNKNIGLEAFKTRSRRSGEKWLQNVLVLDIGGGTTDLALISLLLEENDPFKPGEDRGAGGRYYVLTPELMGASGHLRLGGELLTLRVFLLLKVAIADCILTVVSENKLTNPELENIINSLDRHFCDENGQFESNALLKCVLSQGDSYYEKALDKAEELLPTRWKTDSKRLQAFYILWDRAEEAKLQLGGGIQDFKLEWKEIKNLLTPEISKNIPESLDLSVKITKKQFEDIVSQDIEVALRIAEGLLKSRLPKDESSDKQNKRQPLDWLILSGQTCKLDLVNHKLKEIFVDSEIFNLNKTRITFVDEYAKLATSIGACYAERLQQYRYDPEAAKGKLKDGYSEIQIKVKNLLDTLPCNFERMSQDGTYLVKIFEARQHLYEFEQEGLTKARSIWWPLQPTNTIYRRDYDSANPILWANFVFEDMAKKLGVYKKDDSYLEPFQVQFEVNQKLEISLLLCKGAPHYLINSTSDKLNVSAKILEKSTEVTKQKEQNQNLPQLNTKLINDEDNLEWEIVVGVLEGKREIIFKTGENFNKSFRDSENPTEQVKKGLLSKKPLPLFPENGKHTFYACHPNMVESEHKPIYIGELSPPETDQKPNESSKYYATIDDQGFLRIHKGEYFYWMSKADDHEVLKNQEGCVLWINPDPIHENKDEARNPFSGIH